MAAITDLASASSVGASDVIPINQSGTDKKAAGSLFVKQNTSGVTDALKAVTPTTVSLANNATQAVTGTFGLLIVGNGTDGGQALIWLSSSSVAIISQVGTNIGTTQGTGSKLNVYFSGGACYLENKLGGTKTIYYQVLGI